MNQERLNELKKELMNMLFIALSKLTDKQARENVKQTSVDLIALLDAEIARQNVTDEDVQDAIEAMIDNPLYNADIRETILAALSAYRKPTAEEAERIDQAIEELFTVLYQYHNAESEESVVEVIVKQPLTNAIDLAITALRWMKGEAFHEQT